MQRIAVAATWLMAAAGPPIVTTPNLRPGSRPANDSVHTSVAARLAVLWPAVTAPAFPPSTSTAPRGREAADTLPASVAANTAWTRDGRGFFYTSVPHPWQLFYHSLRHPSPDALIYESPDGKGTAVRAELSVGGQYAVITVTRASDTHTRLVFIDLDDPDHPTVTAPIVKLFDDFDAAYHFAGNSALAFYVWTDRDAPHGRVIRIDATEPRRATDRTVLAETTAPLVGARVAAHRLFVTYLEDGHAALRMFSLSGLPVGTVLLPGWGRVGRVAGGGRGDRDTVYFAYQSVLTPPAVYGFDPRAGNTDIYQAVRVPFDSGRYTMQLLHLDASAHPAVERMPLYVTARTGLTLDSAHAATRAAWVDTTGDADATPLRFSPAAAVWLELGGVYVVPTEHGAAAAQAAAQFLAAHQYARADRVVIAAPPPPSAGIAATTDWLVAHTH